MSGHGDPHEEAHGDDEHEHDDDHHAPPPPPEPATPLWLTLLGIGLFLVVGIVYVATRDDGKTTAELTAAGNPGASAAAPAGAAPNPGGAVRVNAPPNPPGSPQPAVRP
ncbi:MAG: hypothetical protein K0R38_4192 [Polyangiaceae bacterium]|jgi:hypothetical protein|nr:hypothetical protein [Polyangiaceae bacterium]